MKIMHIVGARPNYMKVAPVMTEMAQFPEIFEQVCVHTGQHYDANMSKIFFEDLGMPDPTYYLQVGSGSHAEQTARIMLAFEPVLLEYRPDWVIVVGDVNSTLACSLVCSKLGVKVAHVEAGLRSRDRTMPEEINRLLTDQIADLLFTPSRDGDANLLAEGILAEKIRFVGNVMIDSLVRVLPKIELNFTVADLGLQAGNYLLVTLHRPVNVDQPEILGEMMNALVTLSQRIPIVFPVHPRTRKHLAEMGFDMQQPGLHLLEPLGYLDFLALMKSARLVLTDSGGIQEETTYLGVPCLTARPNTERPVTVEVGTNRLIESTPQAILAAVDEELSGKIQRQARIPELWDGKAAQRIVQVFCNL
jgi:UDP-N-acetylglucosamine 2-epimerase (non-hydrolysing)